jgi:anaerobic magnesium-protoporphyrin IX monomethyl ester cyclase
MLSWAVESLEDGVVAAVRKNNSYAISKQAVTLLRRHRIISLVNIIYGLEDESFARVRHKFRRLLELDPDILNAVYLTPHFWMPAGRDADPCTIIQSDQRLWTYRNQVIATPHLSPWQLSWSVKITEGLFHLRPRAILRLFRGGDWKVRRILRASLLVGIRVVLVEIAEFHFRTRFVTGTWTTSPVVPRSTRRTTEHVQ